MANLITVARLLLLLVVVWLLEREPVAAAGYSMLLLAIVFAGDGLDGWVARRRGSATQFGAVFDIAGDRVVETVLWVVFAHLGLVGLWIPLLVIVRGGIVDALRSISYAEGKTAFGEQNMMRSAITRWLTASRLMRGTYGVAKAAAFVFLAGLAGAVKPEAAGTWLDTLYQFPVYQLIGWLFVWLSVALLLIRGLPVIFDALPYIESVDTGLVGAAAPGGRRRQPESSHPNRAPSGRG